MRSRSLSFYLYYIIPTSLWMESETENLRNPKSDGARATALSEESERQSEEETPLVTSLMKSDRTKASKSDRIAGYAITPRL